MKRTLFSTLLAAISALVLSLKPDINEFISLYSCSICLATVDKMYEDKNSDLMRSCSSLFDNDICASMNFSAIKIENLTGDSRKICTELQKCIHESQSHSVSSKLDVKISRGMGSRGYNKIRVSVVSNASVEIKTTDGGLVDEFYSSQFKYRWTDKYLSSGVTSIKPGENNLVKINGEAFSVYLPPQGEGVRGVILADPCFQSKWILCLYQNTFSMLEHSTALLNAIFQHDDTHYWQILGDNFYDQDGQASSQYFGMLSQNVQQRFFATVPGNHDFWVNSSPKVYVPKDQLGNGFMQFYGQDVIASIINKEKNVNSPYDFTNDPDGPNQGATNLPSASNYFFYNQIGNVAFIGYSGAHSVSTMTSYLTEACDWALANSESIDILLLLGHWNNDGDGCDSDATVPALYSSLISSIPSCNSNLLQPKIKYFMGHKHCNMVTSTDIGFMVGGQGMSDINCGGSFGIPIVDTTNGRFRVFYFEVQQALPFGLKDNYQSVLDCITQNGVSQCYHLAQLWADVPLLSSK